MDDVAEVMSVRIEADHRSSPNPGNIGYRTSDVGSLSLRPRLGENHSANKS